MKIEKRSESICSTFRDLKVEDVFKCGIAEKIYMKIKECSVDKDDCTTVYFNALMLSTGDFCWFIDNEEVGPIPDATLIY